MIDWTKPLELLDGTPVRLDPTESAPDEDGDYWIIREDGMEIDGIHSYCLPPSGDGGDVFVRNRQPTAEAEWVQVGNLAKSNVTLRDRFAMAALTGLIANQQNTGTAEEVAITSYAIATAMLRARGEG